MGPSTAATQQGGIGGVDDRIDFELGDVPFDNFDSVGDAGHAGILIGRPSRSPPVVLCRGPRACKAWLWRLTYLTCIMPTARAPAAAAKMPSSTTCDNVETKTSRTGPPGERNRQQLGPIRGPSCPNVLSGTPCPSSFRARFLLVISETSGAWAS